MEHVIHMHSETGGAGEVTPSEELLYLPVCRNGRGKQQVLVQMFRGRRTCSFPSSATGGR